MVRIRVVERDVRVRKVVHDVNAVLPRQSDHALEEIELDALGGGIARETENHHSRFWQRLANRPLELGEEIDTAVHSHRPNVGAGDDRAIDVNRITRVRHQYRVATIERRQHQMRQPLLGADRDDRLGVRIEFDAIALLVPGRDRAPQPGDPARYRVPVRILPLHGFDQFVDDVTRRRAIRIAHAHVNDVFAAPTRSHLQLTRDVEDVGRQALDARKLGHD